MVGIITLTTDLGLNDAYVAAMKGVILGINPEVRLIDICHTIEPQNILQAAFVLSTAYAFFPEKTIHLVVVDPEVGTKRKAIILRTPSADFVAPDNGALSYVIRTLTKPMAELTNRRQIELKPELEAVFINIPQFWRSPVSPTFHGRDIFAPVAAQLSLGVQPSAFGKATNMITVLPILHPYWTLVGRLVGHIVHIDSFGNLITNIRESDLPQTKKLITIEVGNQIISGLSRTYTQGQGLLALVGSSGYLEIALAGGSARDLIDAKIGNKLTIG
jgi:S-adenosylmethionine hydrolase